MTESVITSFDGVPIRVHQSDLSSPKPRLVIVPPLATRPSFIQAAVGCLTERYTVITWEARLLLEPATPLGDRSALALEAMVKDFELICARLGVEQTLLLGYCSGATLALHIAATSQRVLKLALLNGAYFLPPNECPLTTYERGILDLVELIGATPEGAAAIFAQFFAKRMPSRTPDHEFAAEVQRPYRDSESLYRFGIGLSELIQSRVSQVASEVVMPTFLYCSKRDEHTHYASSQLISAQLRDSRLQVDEYGDHYEFCRANADILEQVSAFCAS